MPYVPAEKYRGKTPESRARQLANLKSGNARRSRREIEKELLAGRSRLGEYRGDPIRYMQDHYFVPETKKAIELLPWQRDVLAGVYYGKCIPSLAVVGSVKKSGKSALAGGVAQYTLTEIPGSKSYILAPDKEAGESVILDSLITSIRLNEVVRNQCEIFKSEVRFRDSFVKVLACDLSISGLRPDLTLVDEAWQFRTTVAKRVLDEMTTNPVGDHVTFVVTYAGYSEDQTEDLHLWRWYSRGRRIEAGEEKPDPKFFFYWKEDYAGVPWVQGSDYLEHQRKTLTPSSFERFHCNKWSASESSFVSPELIDRVTDPDLERGRPCGSCVCIGLDIGVKSDCSGATVVGQDGRSGLALYDHGLWRPDVGRPVDLRSVRDWFRQLKERYAILVCYYDPSQCYLLAEDLKIRDGINMEPYNQTASNMVTASQSLLSLLKSKRLWLYPDEDIRSHLLNSGAKENEHGIRIVKGGSQSHKVDLAVSLAMATQAASEYLLKPAEPCGFIEVGEYCW